MTRWRFARLVRHPVVATVIAVSLFPVVMKLSANAVFVAELFSAGDKPAKIADTRLKHGFDRATAERQIHLALASGNVDLAQSFVDLSKDCHLSIDAALLDKVKAGSEDERSVVGRLRGFIHGFWTGDANDNAAFAGSAVSDALFVGDVRDFVRETTDYVTGHSYDRWILGMSAAGIAATAATYFDGVGLPERLGLSVAKVMRRSGRLSPALATRMAKLAENGELTDLAENVAGVDERAGVETTMDSLALAKDPKDLARIKELAVIKGSKTRAILKLFGRGAFEAGVTVWIVAKWATLAVLSGFSLLFWAITAVLGFLGVCKTLARRVARILTPVRPQALSV